MKKIIVCLLICFVSCILSFNTLSFSKESSPSLEAERTLAEDPNYAESRTNSDSSDGRTVLDIETFIPESVFDNNVHMAIKIMYIDLYSLINIYNKNMVHIGRDVDTMEEMLESLQEQINNFGTKLEILEERVNGLYKHL